MEVTFEFSRAYGLWPVVPGLVVNPHSGERIEVNLVVDTGAESTVLDRSVADAIALVLGTESARLSGLGGSAMAPEGEVDIVLLAEPRLAVRVKAAFVAGIGRDLGNLLGLDYFERVNLGLSHINRTLHFGPA